MAMASAKSFSPKDHRFLCGSLKPLFKWKELARSVRSLVVVVSSLEIPSQDLLRIPQLNKAIPDMARHGSFLIFQIVVPWNAARFFNFAILLHLWKPSPSFLVFCFVALQHVPRIVSGLHEYTNGTCGTSCSQQKRQKRICRKGALQAARSCAVGLDLHMLQTFSNTQHLKSDIRRSSEHHAKRASWPGGC